VLGGIYRDTSNDQRAGIPYLRDIPYLGLLFGNVSKTDRREDLLVFLTPRILGGPQNTMPSADDLWKHRDGGQG
jgi:type IV pilus assembly protein PilQ